MSSSAISFSSASISSGLSVPISPKSAARTKTVGWLASTIDAANSPWPGMKIVSSTLPVGSSLPVVAPPGLTKSSRTGAPVPATPGISMSPSTAALPSSTRKRAWMIFLVLVW